MKSKSYLITAVTFGSIMLAPPLAASGEEKTTCLTAAAYMQASKPIINRWGRQYAAYKRYHLIGGDFDAVGKKYGIDPALLYALVLNESATGSGKKGKVMPWPYTLRDGHGNVYRYKNRQKAAEKLRELAKVTRQIDVGPAQINLKWNGHRVKNPEMLLEMNCSLEVVASILKEKMSRERDPLHHVIGRYYSSRPSLFTRYGIRIYRIWNEIIQMENRVLADTGTRKK